MRQEAKRQIHKAAIESGILKTADNARSTLSGLLEARFENVIIR